MSNTVKNIKSNSYIIRLLFDIIRVIKTPLGINLILAVSQASIPFKYTSLNVHFNIQFEAYILGFYRSGYSHVPTTIETNIEFPIQQD